MNGDILTFASSPPLGDITFSVDGHSNILELKANGDILVKGKLVVNDIEVYEALLEFIRGRRS